jgi:hypothetical protein
MREYHADPLTCPTCGKPILLSQAIGFVNGAYQHATNCIAPPTREAYLARVAAKRAARRDNATGTGGVSDA